MRTDFYVSSLFTPEGERLVLLRPAEIPQSFLFASSGQERLRDVTLLTEDEFRSELSGMGLASDEVDYQLERARGLHLMPVM
jgi:hypothetical protein